MLNFRSKLRQQLLGYYFTNPEAEHYLREIAALLRVDPANLSRELKALVEQGIMEWRVRGRHKFYRLNHSHPLYEEYRRIVFKTIGVEGKLRELLSEMPGIECAYLFGSFTRDKQDVQSDVDLLLVGHPDQEKLASGIRRLEKRLARRIDYVVFSAKEFEARRKKNDAFLRTAMKDSIDLLAA